MPTRRRAHRHHVYVVELSDLHTHVQTRGTTTLSAPVPSALRLGPGGVLAVNVETQGANIDLWGFGLISANRLLAAQLFQ